MRLFRKNKTDFSYTPMSASWREYQDHLKKTQTHGNRKRWVAGAILSALILAGALFTLGNLSSTTVSRSTAPAPAEKAATQDFLITKKDVHILLEHFKEEELLAKQVDLPFKDQQIHLETSLDPDLQSHLIKAMDRKNSRFIGIVVMEADSGRIQALAGFNKTDPDRNPCLLSVFPAASIFKIVTAAAAVDQCGYNADTKMRFNGYKHTLYKNQLKEHSNHYTNTLSFKDSFAQSVNPVFGKLGALYLARTVLEEYATAFGFNQPINFELPVAPSHIRIEEDTYQRAEIASGFNNDTTLSPIHAAMMASAVLNKGRMIAPTIVDRIIDDQGRLLYEARPSWPGRAMSSQASAVLTRLMETTVRSGTGRKAFRNYTRNGVLSKLDIGGKTGSIYNRAHDARFDWFVGFANEKKGPGRLVVAVLVAHEEYIGIRAAQYAKMAMMQYFKSQFAQRTTSQQSSGS
jgi:peptidoglycan glycosyltransferase